MAASAARRLLACLNQATCRGILTRSCASYAASGEEPVDMQTIAHDLNTVVGGLGTVWRGEHGRKVKIHTPDVKSQDELEVRTMQDSYQEAIIPLGSDLARRQEYVNFFQMARIGKILEDLDILADWIAYLHIHGGRKNLVGPSPHTVVTALVDKIDLYDRMIATDQDIKLSGHVSWVGKSAMEVTLKMSQLKPDGPEHFLDACFVMVSRNVANNSSSLVNALKPTNDKERQIIEAGEENQKARIQRFQTALTKMPPTAEESKTIHNTFMQATTGGGRPAGEDVFMENATLKSVAICNPQERNCSNKVFGGFLMLKAYELAWANACLFCQQCPTFLALDDIMFRKPVEIGSILEYTSQVVYTPEQPTTHVQIKTIAEVIEPKTGERTVTNEFHFTFASKDAVRSIVPRTYADAMGYLDGKRRYRWWDTSPAPSLTKQA